MFQDNLKALRKKKGITQEELAARLNVVRQTVSKWEKGVSQTKRYHTKTHAYITSKQHNLEVNPMKKLISCEYNFDNCCVELKFTDGSMIAIDTIAVENEVARNMYERSELDYLIYNAPLEYADLILNGDPESYLKTVTEYKPLD